MTEAVPSSRSNPPSALERERSRFISECLEGIFNDRDVLENIGRHLHIEKPDVTFWKRVLNVVQVKDPSRPLLEWTNAVTLLQRCGSQVDLQSLESRTASALLSCCDPARTEIYNTCSDDPEDIRPGKSFLVLLKETAGCPARLLYIRHDLAQSSTMVVKQLTEDMQVALFPSGVVLQSILLSWKYAEIPLPVRSRDARRVLCEVIPSRIISIQRGIEILFDECAFVVQNGTVLNAYRPQCTVTFAEQSAATVHEQPVRVRVSKLLRNAVPISLQYSYNALLHGSERPTTDGRSVPVLSGILRNLLEGCNSDQALVQCTDGKLVLLTHERHVINS